MLPRESLKHNECIYAKMHRLISIQAEPLKHDERIILYTANQTDYYALIGYFSCAIFQSNQL